MTPKSVLRALYLAFIEQRYLKSLGGQNKMPRLGNDRKVAEGLTLAGYKPVMLAMLHLDKTVTRKTTLHADHDAEDRARWQAMSFTEKREIVLHLQQRKRELHALCEQGREQDQPKNATLLSSELTN